MTINSTGLARVSYIQRRPTVPGDVTWAHTQNPLRRGVSTPGTAGLDTLPAMNALAYPEGNYVPWLSHAPDGSGVWLWDSQNMNNDPAFYYAPNDTGVVAKVDDGPWGGPSVLPGVMFDSVDGDILTRVPGHGLVRVQAEQDVAAPAAAAGPDMLFAAAGVVLSGSNAGRYAFVFDIADGGAPTGQLAVSELFSPGESAVAKDAVFRVADPGQFISDELMAATLGAAYPEETIVMSPRIFPGVF